MTEGLEPRRSSSSEAAYTTQQLPPPHPAADQAAFLGMSPGLSSSGFLDELMQDLQKSNQQDAQLGPRAAQQGWATSAALRTDHYAQLSNPTTFLSAFAGAGASSGLGLPPLSNDVGQPTSPFTNLFGSDVAGLPQAAMNGYGAAQVAQPIPLAYNHDFHQNSRNNGATESSSPSPPEDPEASSGEGSGPGRYEGTRRRRRGPSGRPEQVAVERVSRIKEKNRRAQAAYRVRQKGKLAESEARVEELSAELAKLRSEAASLESRNSLLERVVALQASAGSQPIAAAPALKGPKAVPQLGAPPSCPLLGMGKGHGVGVGGDPKQKLNMWAGLSWTPDQPVTISVRQGQKVQMSVEDVGKMALTQFMSLWKEYVSAFATLLLQAPDDHSADSPISRQCKVLMDEIAVISFCHKAHGSHSDLHAIKHMRMDTLTNSPDERPTADLWRSSVAACKLTEQQRLDITAARRAYLAKLRANIIERQTILAALQTNLPNGTGEPFVMAPTILARLHSNMQAESEAGDWFQCTIGSSILSPLQCANMMVQAYPWVPNLIAIGNVVAEQMGEPGTLQLLEPPGSASAAAASTTTAAAAGNRPGMNQPGPGLAGRAAGGSAAGGGAGLRMPAERPAVAVWGECH